MWFSQYVYERIEDGQPSANEGRRIPPAHICNCSDLKFVIEDQVALANIKRSFQL